MPCPASPASGRAPGPLPSPAGGSRSASRWPRRQRTPPAAALARLAGRRPRTRAPGYEFPRLRMLPRWRTRATLLGMTGSALGTRPWTLINTTSSEPRETPGPGGADAGTRTPNLPLTRFTLCRSHGVPGRPCAGQGYGGHIGGESERPRTETPFEPPCQGDLARREQGGPLFPLRDHVMVGGTCPGSPAPPHVRGVGWRCMLSVSPGPDPLTARHSPRRVHHHRAGRTCW